MSTELAWAAGLFDGEGCTSISRSRKYRQIQMFVSQSYDPFVLQRFQAAVGFGRVRGPYRGSNPRAKLKYCWHVSKLADAERVMAVLWPYLSSPKKVQYLHCVEELHMAKQEYSFTSPGLGRTHQVSSEDQAADSPDRPEIPQLQPSIRGIAENAGFDSNAMEGEALIRKSEEAPDNSGVLRDGDNSKSLGDQPDYPVNVMGQAFKGRDERPGR